MPSWQTIRNEHVFPKGTYLNTSANGLMPKSVVEAGLEADREFISNPGRYRQFWVEEGVHRVRNKLSSLLGVSATTLALVPSFSTAINYILPSFKERKTVLLLANEYPSLALPFTLHGFDILSPIIPKDQRSTELIIKEIDRIRPDIVAISHIQWLSGFKTDLRLIGAFCRQNDTITVVDSTQSFGAHQVAPSSFEVDVLAASAYKWPVAGFGNGFLYCNEALFDKLDLRVGGYNSFASTSNGWTYQKSMMSFEPGHSDHVSFSRLSAAIDRINTIGLENISRRLNQLSQKALTEIVDSGHLLVAQMPPECRSSILSIVPKGQTFAQLKKHNIEFSKRAGCARIGLHYYNNDDDIQVLSEALNF